MAGIDDIISGVGGNTRADFSHLSDGFDAYNAARDQKAKNELRDAFKGGVPLTPDGQPDFGAMAKTLFQKGGLSEGTAAANLGLAQQNMQFGQGQSNAIRGYEGGPAANLGPPSANRSIPISGNAPVRADPAGVPATPARAPQGDQPGSIVGLISAAGIPDELAGPVIQQVSALTKMDPNAALDPTTSQRVQQVVQAAAQRTKGGQQPQPSGLVPQQSGPQVVPALAQAPQPQMALQGQPAPVTNALTTTQSPATPSRVDQGIAFYSGIMSDPRSPKQNVELAKSRLEALQKSSELTPDQKNYVQYKLEGGKGTMQDFLSETEASKAGATERAKADIGEQQEYIKGGKVASDRLTTLNTISNIIGSDDKMRLGFGADASLKIGMALKAIGVDVGDLSGPQAIQKLNAVLASESAKGVGARPTQFEFKTFLANNPGLSMDKAGNERVIGIYSQLAKREVDLGRLARQNQDNWSNWDNVVEKYDKTHQIKDPSSGKVITTDSIVAPGPRTNQQQPSSTKQFSSPSDVHAAIAAGQLKKGDIFTDPSGKTRMIP